MKQIKCFLMILTAVFFCLMSAPAMAVVNADDIAAADKSLNFADVAQDFWGQEAIRFVYENGLMKGESSTEFRPLDYISRGMLVTVLYRIEGEPELKGSSDFWDVRYGDYYYNAVIWAVANGIAQGVSATEFNADIPLTKEQGAAMLRRYSEYKGYDVAATASLGGFVDGGMVSSWAAEDVSWCVGAGLLRGNTGGTLSAQAFLTRNETAVVLMRYCTEYLPSKAE